MRQEVGRGWSWLFALLPGGIRPWESLFPWKITMETVLGLFPKDWSFPSPARAKRGPSSDSHCDNLVGFLKVKPMKVGGPQDKAPRSSHSHSGPHSASTCCSRCRLSGPASPQVQGLCSRKADLGCNPLYPPVSPDCKVTTWPVTSGS